MSLVARLLGLVGGEDDTNESYKCIRCGRTFERDYYECPDCGVPHSVVSADDDRE